MHKRMSFKLLCQTNVENISEISVISVVSYNSVSHYWYQMDGTRTIQWLS